MSWTNYYIPESRADLLFVNQIDSEKIQDEFIEPSLIPNQSLVRRYGIADSAKYNKDYVNIIADLNISWFSFKEILDEFTFPNQE